ncbi:MAG TPA: prepilin-type N-terminal cleavage/methylation domain-containing protein [Tepidisphaeraceae bacterium]|nr:prepilin-type N-terminal cleavage/methylation domain-containing protein [Tepidisphaeraceae bacterium]
MQPPRREAREEIRSRPSRGGGFTLVEMLVVIAIIVGVLAMAVPLVSTLNGSRSVEAGYNVLSSALAHARELAVANHQIAGAFVYIDATTGRSAIVFVEPTPNTAYPPPYPLQMPGLAIISGEDTVYMPPSVGVRVLNNNTASGVSQPDDRYLATGAILFDQNGNVTYQDYNILSGNNLATRLGVPETYGGPQTYQFNSLGAAVIYDRTAYMDQTTAAGDPFTEADFSTQGWFGASAPYGEGNPVTTADKENEESWLDQNGLLVMVRAGDGALVQSK